MNPQDPRNQQGQPQQPQTGGRIPQNPGGQQFQQVPPNQQYGQPQQNQYAAAPPQGGAGIGLGIAAIISGFILPPLGLVLGILSMMKGFNKMTGNKMLGIFGAAAIVTSIAGAGLYATLLLSSDDSGTTTSESRDYSELNAQDEVFNERAGTYRYLFDLPTGFTKTEELIFSNAATWQDIDSQGLEIGRIVIAVEEFQDVNFSISAAEESLASDLGIRAFSGIIENYTGGSNVVLGAPNLDFTSTLDDSFIIPFSYDDPSRGKVRGEMMFGYDETANNGYTLIIASNDTVWSSNTEQWLLIQQSFEPL